MNIKKTFISLLLFLLTTTTCIVDCMNAQKFISEINKNVIKFVSTSFIYKRNPYSKKYFHTKHIPLKSEVIILPASPHDQEKTIINYFLDKTNIGYTMHENSSYYDSLKKQNYMYLDALFVREIHRKSGFGKKIFMATMQMIKKKFHDIESVRWSIYPIGKFDSSSEFLQAKYNLYRFYRNLGAEVDEKTDQAEFNLKNMRFNHEI